MSIVIIFVSLYVIVLILLYVAQEKLIFVPETLTSNQKFGFPVPFEEVWIENEGVRLHSLRFPKSESKGVILYFHGNAGSLLSWGGIYEDFQRFPYDLWIVDYRGYGKSEGVILSEESLHSDAEAFYQQAIKRYKGKEILIYGRSIGTGIASQLAAKHPPKMLFLETPYYNFPDLVGTIYPFVPSALVRYKLANDENIRDASYPVYLFHGDQDGLIPHDSSLRLETLGAHIILHTIEDAGHNNISNFRVYHKILNGIIPQK